MQCSAGVSAGSFPALFVSGVRLQKKSRGRGAGDQKQSTESRTALSKDEAWQGVTGHNVRYVLGIGLTAAAVAPVLIYAFYFAA
jgi:hypothetical protein